MDKFARFKFQPCIPLGEDGRCVTASKKHINLSRKACLPPAKKKKAEAKEEVSSEE